LYFWLKKENAGVKKTKRRAEGGTKKKAVRTRSKKRSEKPATITDDLSAKKRDEAPDPVDLAEAREIVAAMVRKSARKIAEEIIKVAETGQLAPAKYLFEAVGLYPPGPEAPKPEESLAYSLLKRMGLQPEGEISEAAEKDKIREGAASDDKHSRPNEGRKDAVK
jgi:hypothetical protein